MDPIKSLLDKIRSLFNPQPAAPAAPSPAPATPAAARVPTGPLQESNKPSIEDYGVVGQTPAPVTRKVLVLTFDPHVPSQGNQPLTQALGGRSVDALISGFLSDLSHASGGYANFNIVDRITVDGMPAKMDGFTYTGDQIYTCCKNGSGFHTPDAVDYQRLADEHEITRSISLGKIDEVWLFGPPGGGFYESIMAGPGAFPCNAPILQLTPQPRRRFIMMGFNYVRGVGEMLESMGHRAEFILRQTWRAAPVESNLFARFCRFDKAFPGKAEVGTIHFAPNSKQDYEWGSRAAVPSNCDSWYHFPSLTDAPRSVDCSEWGNGDIRAHHVWWFNHLPKNGGVTGGIANNWWRYVVDPEKVK